MGLPRRRRRGARRYGTIYTTKPLRRGTDIDRARPWRALRDLKVADVMQAFRPRSPLPGPGPQVAAPAGGRPWLCPAR
jgi:hypothetical protein